jgi:hypothetical protein
MEINLDVVEENSKNIFKILEGQNMAMCNVSLLLAAKEIINHNVKINEKKIIYLESLSYSFQKMAEEIGQ